jgi:prepilin-type N-terminal cleavage/methylation domain-containing protein
MKNKGFTLIEMMITISILGVMLASGLFPGWMNIFNKTKTLENTVTDPTEILKISKLMDKNLKHSKRFEASPEAIKFFHGKTTTLIQSNEEKCEIQVVSKTTPMYLLKNSCFAVFDVAIDQKPLIGITYYYQLHGKNREVLTLYYPKEAS